MGLWAGTGMWRAVRLLTHALPGALLPGSALSPIPLAHTLACLNRPWCLLWLRGSNFLNTLHLSLLRPSCLPDISVRTSTHLPLGDTLVHTCTHPSPGDTHTCTRAHTCPWKTFPHMHTPVSRRHTQTRTLPCPWETQLVPVHPERPFSQVDVPAWSGGPASPPSPQLSRALLCPCVGGEMLAALKSPSALGAHVIPPDTAHVSPGSPRLCSRRLSETW